MKDSLHEHFPPGYTRLSPNELIKKHKKLVVAIVRRRAHNLPDADQDDLIQEGCLGLLEAAKRFNPKLGFQFSTFAYRRISGAVADAMKRLHPDYPFSQLSNDNPEGEYEIGDAGEGALAARHTLEEHILQVVRDFMKRLSPLQRKIAHLLFWKSYSQADVAKVLGVSQPRVAQILGVIRERGLGELRDFRDRS